MDTYATKEPETLDWLDAELRPSDVFFDIGANIGLYSLYAVKRCPEARVYAFEPDSQNFASLCHNLILNDCHTIIPCNVCLSDRVAFDYFHVSRFEAGAAMHSFGSPSPWTETTALIQGSLSISLDELVTNHKAPCPTLIKVDVDGLETKILEGAQNVLRAGLVRSLLIEVEASEDLQWAERWLKPYGYSLTKTGEWIYESHGLKAQNQIFRRKSFMGSVA